MIENHVYAAMLHHSSQPLACRWIELAPMLQRRANHAVVVACKYNLFILYIHSLSYQLLCVSKTSEIKRVLILGFKML